MSSMADLAGMLGGGGGAPPGPGGPPVDLGAGAGPPTDLGAPPPDQGADTGGGEFANSLEALDAAEKALHAFIQLDEDEPDRAQASQALQVVLKLKASNQQAQESGGMKGLARALQAGGGPAAGGPPGGGY
jgi:hypothetical protein